MASVQTFVYNMVRKHETMGKTPAMALGVVDMRWSLEMVVDMVDAYLRSQQDRVFENAIASEFSEKPQGARTVVS